MGCARRYRRWIDAALARGISSRRWQRLRPHLEQCAACRRRYEQVVAIARSLAPGSTLAAFEIDLVGREVLASAAPPPKRTWIFGAAAASAAAALILVLALPRGENGLRPRGHAPAFSGRPPGARVFCVDRDSTDGTRVSADVRATELTLQAPVLHCSLENRLQLAYSSPRMENLTMVAFARSTSGDVFWYAPRSSGESALALVPDSVERPLDWSTKLGVNHAPGSYDVHVMFFDAPVRAEDAASGRAVPVQDLALRLEIEEQPQ